MQIHHVVDGHCKNHLFDHNDFACKQDAFGFPFEDLIAKPI